MKFLVVISLALFSFTTSAEQTFRESDLEMQCLESINWKYIHGSAQPSEEEVENCREEARQQYLAEERARAERERQFASSKASDEYMQCLESANWEYIHGGATPTEEDEQKCIAETKSSKDKAEAARDIVECVNQAKSGEDIERCQDEFGPL